MRYAVTSILHALQASSPSARNAAAPAVENGSDGEPLQINAARHKTYSESELVEMETGVHTPSLLPCMYSTNCWTSIVLS